MDTKPKKGRTMSPELLEKLAQARERAKEMREQTKAQLEKVKNDPVIAPEEKTKVAKYLAKKKIEKEKIQAEIKEELQPKVDACAFEPEPEPEKKKKKKIIVISSDSESSDEEEYTIKIPKRTIRAKKVIKETSEPVKIEKAPEPLIVALPEPPRFNKASHLINLCRGGYQF